MGNATGFGRPPGCEAWEAIAAHLRAEAEWRAGRDVDPISRYKTRECLGGYTLTAEFSCWEAMVGADGAAYGQNLVGDVFEQAASMIAAGRRAMDGLQRQLAAGSHGGGPVSVEDGASRSGRRDGSWVELTIDRWSDIPLPDEMEGAGKASGPAFADDKEPGGEKSSEKYLRHVLERAMAASRVERHNEGDEGDRHDYDLVAADGGMVEARVECTELTVEATEALASRCWEPKQPKGRPPLRFRWEARLTITGLDDWQALDGDKEAREARRQIISDEVAERVRWAEGQMGTPKGTENLANDRSQSYGTGWRTSDDTGAKAHFSAEQPPPGASGSLQVRAGGDSAGWAGSPYGAGSVAAARIDGAVDKKADKNQARAHPEPKWLLVDTSGLWTPAEKIELDGRLADPEDLAAFAAEIDLRCFDEVWVVWETSHAGRQATAVIVLAKSGPPRCFLTRTEWQHR